MDSTEGKLQKMLHDYSKEVDAALQSAQQLIQNQPAKLQQALDPLLVLEKKTRHDFDTASNGRLLPGIIQLCFDCRQWKVLQDQLQLLSKKHGLIKSAVVALIQRAMQFLDHLPELSVQLEVLKTLLDVTEGKIYVELERAKLTRRFAKIKEDQGLVQEAADILQELHVETFGSMDRREKTDFILEQMRLNLLRKDFIRTQIISKKINTKYFEKEDVQDLKLRYYELMIQNALHDNQYLNVCKYYREVYNTKSVQEDQVKWSEILRFIVVFAILAPFDHEQSDLLHRIAQDKQLEKLPLFQQLLKSFSTSELMRWPKVEEIYRNELQKLYPFNPQLPEGQKRWKDLHHRVIEHNIRVVAKYYQRITIRRLTELLDLPAPDTETFLSKLVTSKTLYARIDRIGQQISFVKPKAATEVVDEWTSDVHSLLDLVAKANHLITKEEMVHRIAAVNGN